MRQSFAVAKPTVVIQRDQCYNVPGSSQYCPRPDSRSHLIFADSWSKEWGQPQITEQLENPKLRVLGIVIRKVDKIMHGMELGAAGMHNQVRQWAKQGFMLNILALLHDNGYRVYLASDHGNVEAKGVGQPTEGAVADTRGQRVRVYPDRLLRDQVKKRFPESVEWPPVGLPEDYLALIAPNRAAFVRKGERTVCHGGISIDELLVPLVRIDWRDQ